MNHPNRIVSVALTSALLLCLTSGCSILHFDKGMLAVVTPLSVMHDSIEATAVNAPDSAETAYNNLRRDLNAFISRQQAVVTDAGATMVTSVKINFSDVNVASDPAVQQDLSAFAAAAPNAPTWPVLNAAMNANGAVTRIYPEVSAIKDSRSDQASTLNRELERFKLAPWESIHRAHSAER